MIVNRAVWENGRLVSASLVIQRVEMGSQTTNTAATVLTATGERGANVKNTCEHDNFGADVTVKVDME